MLSKAKIKLVQSLKDKKQRTAHMLFAAEGAKIVPEVLASKIKVKTLFATQQWLNSHHAHVDKNTEVIEVDDHELKQVSFMQAPQQVMALCEIPEHIPFKPSGLTLLLDTIQDPGNLGTIIRVADWYGVKDIVCSKECADVYAPKVIQATMGSFTRVNIYEMELDEVIDKHGSVPVYGAVMNGENLYRTQMAANAFLLIGNEGGGISDGLLKKITRPVTVPRRGGAESLNAGIAAAVICDAWARERDKQ